MIRDWQSLYGVNNDDSNLDGFFFKNQEAVRRVKTLS